MFRLECFAHLVDEVHAINLAGDCFGIRRRGASSILSISGTGHSGAAEGLPKLFRA